MSLYRNNFLDSPPPLPAQPPLLFDAYGVPFRPVDRALELVGSLWRTYFEQSACGCCTPPRDTVPGADWAAPPCPCCPLSRP